MIAIRLNGEERRLEEPLTLVEFLKHIKIISPAIAVAINSEVVPRSEFDIRRLGHQDQVEIIHPVGGG